MIPGLEELASSKLTHRAGDLFNPPGLTNFLGCVQSGLDPTGISSLTFPPIASGETLTGALFVDGRYFASAGRPVSFRWLPDRIERSAEWEGLLLTSTTLLPWGMTAAMVVLEVTNQTDGDREVDLRFGVQSSITNQKRTWGDALPPWEEDNEVVVDRDRGAVVFSSRHTAAASVQGTSPRADAIDGRSLYLRWSLKPKESRRVSFIAAVGESQSQAAATFDTLAAEPDAAMERSHAEWIKEIEAIFTPGNGRYSGSLPRLETDDETLRRIYHTAALGVAYFKRESPQSVVGKTYDTLMPRYWQSVTFLWDYSLSSLVHVLLDPAVMRGHLEHWMRSDIHKCFGTDWLTGGIVGTWYSVNDHAMTLMIDRYLRWSGEMSWLDRQVAGVGTVRDMLTEYARNWQSFQTPQGLADYGGIGNLLECVSTYVHEVASLNAANVWNLRTAAGIHEHGGDAAVAAALRAEAAALIEKVGNLYADGKGFWCARFPDGRLVPVRHCYDFLTILNLIDGDLTDAQKSEMANFFERELKTPLWMHALSPEDPDAITSVRPDHQWNGAYTAWPALSVTGLCRIGRHEMAFEWLKGLAGSANQGPFGQAHFVETVVPPDEGGAIKAPSDFPYINDWACSSNGAWANVILESVFGINAGMDGTLSANPNLEAFDAGARLVDLPYRGRLYTVDRTGIVEQ